MKFLIEKYRVVSIWLSLAILVLGFCIGADQECRSVCVPLAFLLGAVLYLLGSIYEWKCRRRFASLVLVLLTFLMLAGVAVSFLYRGGSF